MTLIDNKGRVLRNEMLLATMTQLFLSAHPGVDRIQLQTFARLAVEMGYRGPYVAGLITLSHIVALASLPLALGLLS